MNEKEILALLNESGCSLNVIEHCRAVAGLAGKIALDISKASEIKGIPLNIDINDVYSGALLHDIGRSRTHGIAHAVEGARIAREKGLEKSLVNIIERHIGAGITKEEAANIGLPIKDYLPQTLEEKIVAHADNLIFGKNIGTIEECVVNLRKKGLGEAAIQRIIRLNDEISEMSR
ncbi:MAG: TIGR00295 family protein [Candidatus Methanoperedens sp.]|nr:TIGR00295 family protein [Candidatus Methanoperedens sp.]MCE8428385.1 TIGR00295 family protein [Candidatus Methanoperedens sp.]